MRCLTVATLSLGLLALGGASPVFADFPNTGLHRCTKTTIVSDTSTAADTFSNLTGVPAIVCSVDFRPNVNGGWVELFDAPVTDVTGETHGQKRTICELGNATSGTADHAFFGNEGVLTYFGLSARVKDGLAVIRWDD